VNNSKGSESPLVLSYLALRRAIGILGITLPLVLLLGALVIFQTRLQSSISSYYYTGMRDVLVGILVAVGVFLFSYRGYPGDATYGKIACVAAIGVALFPTTPQGKATDIARTIGFLHLVFTIVFFAMLVIFSYFLFTKSDQDPLPPKKRHRNLVYRICGILMAICMVGIVIVFFLPDPTLWLGDHAVFWLETAAIWAFGVSWFTKGEAIAMLNDPVASEDGI
jgi:hypothetical protein